MGLIKQHSNYLKQLKESIEGINLFHMVDDHSDLNNYLRDLSSLENALMLGVIPVSGNNSPEDVDSFQNKYYCEVIIGHKVDVSALTENEFVDTFDITHELALKFQKSLLDALASGECGLMRYLDPKSIQIPTFRRSQFLGWNVIFTFDFDI